MKLLSDLMHHLIFVNSCLLRFNMIYYIFIYYRLLHSPFLFTTINYIFDYIIYHISQFGSIYYHLFHLLQMVLLFITIHSIYNLGDLEMSACSRRQPITRSFILSQRCRAEPRGENGREKKYNGFESIPRA